jgi:ketosteroid isomerase-like protein
MLTNKEIIRKVNEAFAADDTAEILFHVADDVHWIVAGFSIAVGKEAFRKEIHNDAFEGVPVITIKNEIAEGDYVAVEGTVLATLKGGTKIPLLFHNTYRLEDGKIKEMTSYVVPEKAN